nr:MAG TPA: hypothetical protein [Caudoviricetes sp.]DAP02740.1 MAG TPA: hypothetical protein [Caudoviricetes sp.]
MEKEWNRKIFGTKKRGFRSLRKPRKDKKVFCIGKLWFKTMRICWVTIRHRF